MCRACLRKFMALLWGGFGVLELLDGPFQVNPIAYALTEVQRYRKVMGEALQTSDFSKYSERRCVQDLTMMGYPNHGNIVNSPRPDLYEDYRQQLMGRI